MQAIAQLAPFLTTGLVILVELVTLRRPRADAQARDRGTFWVIQIAISAGMTVGISLWRSAPLPSDPHFPAWAAVLGLGLALSGAAIRLWAIRTLGQYFTRDIQVSSSQKVVDTGPYRLVRHPSYTGSLLEFLGVGLSLGSFYCLLCVFVPPVVTLFYRMRIEEQELLRALGDPYRQYLTRTKRVVPYLL